MSVRRLFMWRWSDIELFYREPRTLDGDKFSGEEERQLAEVLQRYVEQNVCVVAEEFSLTGLIMRFSLVVGLNDQWLSEQKRKLAQYALYKLKGGTRVEEVRANIANFSETLRYICAVKKEQETLVEPGGLDELVLGEDETSKIKLDGLHAQHAQTVFTLLTSRKKLDSNWVLNTRERLWVANTRRQNPYLVEAMLKNIQDIMISRLYLYPLLERYGASCFDSEFTRSEMPRFIASNICVELQDMFDLRFSYLGFAAVYRLLGNFWRREVVAEEPGIELTENKTKADSDSEGSVELFEIRQ